MNYINRVKGVESQLFLEYSILGENIREEVIKCQDALNGLKRKAIKRGGALKGQSDVTRV